MNIITDTATTTASATKHFEVLRKIDANTEVDTLVITKAGTIGAMQESGAEALAAGVVKLREYHDASPSDVINSYFIDALRLLPIIIFVKQGQAVPVYIGDKVRWGAHDTNLVQENEILVIEGGGPTLMGMKTLTTKSSRHSLPIPAPLEALEFFYEQPADEEGDEADAGGEAESPIITLIKRLAEIVAEAQANEGVEVEVEISEERNNDFHVAAKTVADAWMGSTGSGGTLVALLSVEGEDKVVASPVLFNSEDEIRAWMKGSPFDLVGIVSTGAKAPLAAAA